MTAWTKTTKWFGVALAATMLLGGALGASAQGRDRGRDRGQARGRDRGQQQGRDRRAERGQARGRVAFMARDREAARAWERRYARQRDRFEGFRNRDRLPRGMESRLRAGVVLDPDMRRYMYRVPPSLLVTLAPAPPRYRYVVIGGNICLIDSGYRVADVLQIGFNF